MNAPEFITGLMGAGKSQRLISDYRKETRSCIVLVANFEYDTGDLHYIESRDGTKAPSIVLNPKDIQENIEFIKNIVDENELEVLFIDEIQFLSVEVLNFILLFCKLKKIEVTFYGLKTDFTAQPFEAAKFLFEMIPIRNITFLPSKCRNEGCNLDAKYNARIVDGKVIRFGDTFVSDKGKYLALCENCYFE